MMTDPDDDNSDPNKQATSTSYTEDLLNNKDKVILVQSKCSRKNINQNFWNSEMPKQPITDTQPPLLSLLQASATRASSLYHELATEKIDSIRF